MYFKIVNFYMELILFIRGCLCLVVYILNIVSGMIIVYNVDFFFLELKLIVCCNKYVFYCFR